MPLETTPECLRPIVSHDEAHVALLALSDLLVVIYAGSHGILSDHLQSAFAYTKSSLFCNRSLQIKCIFLVLPSFFKRQALSLMSYATNVSECKM